MDECLQVLEEVAEVPLDLVLVHQVRLQLVADDAIRSQWPPPELTDHLRLLQSFQGKAISMRVQELKQSISVDLQVDRE
jgi:hypothetical protein